MFMTSLAPSLLSSAEVQLKINESLDIQDNLSFKYKGIVICESFMPAGANEDTDCRIAITRCENLNQRVLRDLLNDTAVSNACLHVSSFDGSNPPHWMCPASRWFDIMDYIKNTATTEETKNSIRTACKALSLEVSKTLSPSVFSPVEIYGLHDPADKDFQLAGEEICKSFLKASANTGTDECRASIEDCVRHNAGLFEAVIKDQNEAQFAQKAKACEEITADPKHWTCSYKRWQDIVDYIKSKTTQDVKSGMEKACVSSSMSGSGTGTPGAGAPPSTGSAPGATPPPPPPEGGEDKATCAMNPLAVSNFWSFLPFFVLMLLFGVKRKVK